MNYLELDENGFVKHIAEKFYEELTESVNLLKQSVTGNTIALRVDGANILILPEKNGGVDDENVTWPEYIFSHSRLLCGQLVEQLVTENSSERTKLRRTGDFSKVCNWSAHNFISFLFVIQYKAIEGFC